MEPILKFEQVSKDYPNGVHALKNVSFQVKEGEFISIIGPSGSGKSTLLRAINRLIPISGGSLWLDGQEVSRQRGQNLRIRSPKRAPRPSGLHEGLKRSIWSLQRGG